MSDAHQADSGSTRVRHCRVSCCDCKPPARSMRRAERTLMPTFAAAPSCSHCFRCSMYLATCVRLMRLPGIATLPRFEECDSSHPQTHPGAQVTGQDSCRRPAKIIVVDQMPKSVGLPPLECCRGTNPNHAAICRPFAKFFASPTEATSAFAVIGPIPGTL